VSSQHDFTRKASMPKSSTFTLTVRRQRAANSLTPVFGVRHKQTVAGDGRVTEILLGEFAKLRKVGIGFGIEQLGYRWPDFHGIWCLSAFLISAEKIQQIYVKCDCWSRFM
jgi:hypothetical protein